MITSIPPSSDLTPYIHGYYFGLALKGEFSARPMHFAPHAGGCLVLNLANLGQSEDGETHGRSSLSCLRNKRRILKADDQAYEVHVALTVAGMLRFFPGATAMLADSTAALAAVLGATEASRLEAEVMAAWHPLNVASVLDGWFLRRMEQVTMSHHQRLTATAFEALQRSTSVKSAADQVGISVRQLNRWFRNELGTNPKGLVEIIRVRTSLDLLVRRAVRRRLLEVNTSWLEESGPYAGYYNQGHLSKVAVFEQNGSTTEEEDPYGPFCDQGHLIRTTRRRFGTTPHRYINYVLNEMHNSGVYGRRVHYQGDLASGPVVLDTSPSCAGPPSHPL